MALEPHQYHSVPRLLYNYFFYVSVFLVDCELSPSYLLGCCQHLAQGLKLSKGPSAFEKNNHLPDGRLVRVHWADQRSDAAIKRK